MKTPAIDATIYSPFNSYVLPEGECMTMDSLAKICVALDCTLDDIVEVSTETSNNHS